MLHDWVVILSVMELTSNLLQVPEDVQRWAGLYSRINRVVSIWYELVIFIREQGSLVSQYLAGTQLPSLLQTVVRSTLCLFSALLVLNGAGPKWGETEDGKVLAGNLVCTVVLLLKMYHKVSLAQATTNQVCLGQYCIAFLDSETDFTARMVL